MTGDISGMLQPGPGDVRPIATTLTERDEPEDPNAPVWRQGPSGGDVYALPNGHIIFDDVMGRWFGLPK